LARYRSDKLINNNLIKFLIYLHTYSIAFGPVIKETLAKETKKKAQEQKKNDDKEYYLMGYNAV
jgi:hypothetical protein